MSDGVHAVVRAAALAAALTLGIGCAGSDGEGEPAGEEAPEEPRSELFKVPTEHMEPALRFGELVKITSDAESFLPGEIVVFRPPSNAEANECAVQPKPGQACPQSATTPGTVRFVQRVVAVGGERLAIQRGRVIVEGGQRPTAMPPRVPAAPPATCRRPSRSRADTSMS